MNNLKKMSLAILVAIVAIVAYFIVVEADVEDDTYHLDQQASSEVTK